MKSPRSMQSPTPDIVAATAALLSDHLLRREFCRSPRQVARQMGLVGAELEFVAQLDPAGLNHQAETLLQKRWHEVAELLPISIAELGDEAEELFRYYAQQTWPKGHRRHSLDAANFVGFLEHNQLVRADLAEKRRVRRLAFASTVRAPLESFAGVWRRVCRAHFGGKLTPTRRGDQIGSKMVSAKSTDSR